jgi:hypothetical protein
MRGTAVLLGVVLTLGAYACLVQLQGAPCEGDENCPRSQYCSRDGGCLNGQTPIDLACERVTKALTSRVAECAGGEPGAYQLLVGTDRLCEAVGASVDGGREAYDASALADCTAALASRTCDSVLAGGNPLAGCAALTPRVPEGGLCGNSLDCASGYCDTSANCPGQCRHFIAAGAPCDPAGQGCQEGTTCFAGHCQPYGDAGVACNLLTPACAPDLGCIAGQCGQKLTTDGGCTVLGSECAAGYSCVGQGFTGRTCQPARPLGAPCTPGQGECAPLLWCGGTPATCRLWAQHHEPCGLIGGELVGCLGGRCSGGICEDYLGTGEKCTGNGDCGPAGRCVQVGSNVSVCQPSYCD